MHAIEAFKSPVIGLACFVSLGCSTSESAHQCLGRESGALYGASSDASASLGEHAAELEDTIGRAMINGWSPSGPVSGTCTVVRIAPDWVITARHCLSDLRDPRITVNFAPDQRPASCTPGSDGETPGVLWLAHPHLDVLLIQLATSIEPAIDLGAEPVALNSRVTMAGYGLREDQSHGIREFLAARVTAIAGDHLRVSAGEDAGACIGDSGGPLLIHEGHADLRLIGVLSTGSPTCAGFDDYVRADLFRDWVNQAIN
jgi:hypothetical protein